MDSGLQNDPEILFLLQFTRMIMFFERRFNLEKYASELYTFEITETNY